MQNDQTNLNSLFYLSPTPMFLYEAKTYKIVEANNAALHLYKYTKDEFLELKTSNLCITNEIEQLQDVNLKLELPTENNNFGSCTHKTKLGGALQLNITGHVTTFNYTKCMLLFCQKDNKPTTFKSKSDLMIESSLDVFCIVNESDKFEYVSQAAQQHWGYSPTELIGKSIHDLIYIDDQTETGKTIATLRDGQQIKSFVNRYVKKDGTLAYNLWSAKWDATTKLRYAVAKDYKEKIEQDQKLALSEQRFKALVQEGSDLIVLLDANANYIYINPSNQSLFGFDQENYVGKNAFEFIHPDDLPQTKLSLERTATEKKVIVPPYRFKNNNNEWRWLQTVLTNLLDNPAVQAIVANSTDITDQKKLQELNEQVGQMSKIGIWELDLVNNTLYWSDEVHSIHETNRENYIPHLKDGINFYREDFREQVKAAIEKSMETGEMFEFEAIITTAKNKELWVRSIGNPEIKNGKCVRIFGGFQNIDERKRIEEEKIILQTSLENSLNEIYIFDTTTLNFVYVNKGARTNLGYSHDELKKLTPLDIKPDYTIETFEQLIGPLLRKEKNRIVFYTNHKRKDTSLYPVEVHLQILEQGTSKQFLAIILDITDEKKMQEMVSQTNELAKIGNWSLELATQKIHWSTEVHKLHGTNENSFVPSSESGINFYRHDFHQLVKDSIEKCITFGEPFDFEAVIVTTNQKEIWVRVIGKAEFTNGTCTSIYGSFQDINDLKETESRLIAFSENLPGIIYQYLLYPDGTDALTFVSGDIEELWGCSAAEVKANTNLVWDQIKAGGDFDEVQASIVHSITTKSRWISRFRHVMPNGEQKVRLGTGAPTFLTDGTIVFNSMVVDITAEAKNETLLRLANERFEKATEATNDAIWDWNLIDKSYYRSEAIDKFFGKNTSKAFTDNEFWQDNYHPDDSQKLQDSIYKAVHDPHCHRWELEYRIYNHDKEIIYVSDCGIIIRDDQGIATRMIGAMTNVTEQKLLTLKLNKLNKSLQKYTRELEQSNEELEQFAFVASHDLQEPLRMISSFMELLQRKYSTALDEKAHQYINFATTGAKRMQQIILDLLEYAKVSKIKIEQEDVDLATLIEDYQLLRKNRIDDKKALFSTSALPKIQTSKAAITQIMHCILDNALKYTKNGTAPIINISVLEQQKEWKFAITDNGIGIDNQFLAKIFIIFQRLHNKTDYPGTGIGLSIAKKHVEFLGGRIWLDSELEIGSTFYFTIPKTRQIITTQNTKA